MTIDKIVLLDALSQPPAVPKFAYVLRLDVPRFRWQEFRKSIASSHFPYADEEALTALREGRIVEELREFTVTVATWANVQNNAAVRDQIKAALQTEWQTAQDALTGTRQWALYGAGWTGGTDWHL